MNLTLVIITGMPGTGKTTLGHALSQKYNLPLISKDALKERMFDTLGSSDKAWSLKVSAASHRIMDYFLAELFSAGHSVIVESNFKHDIDSERFRALQRHYNLKLVQILCYADGEVVFDRFATRIANAERHEGHVELPLEQIHSEFVAANGRDNPLDIEGTTIELDTSDLSAIDYASVYAAIDS